jgi:hypothetical protein
MIEYYEVSTTLQKSEVSLCVLCVSVPLCYCCLARTINYDNKLSYLLRGVQMRDLHKHRGTETQRTQRLTSDF